MRIIVSSATIDAQLFKDYFEMRKDKQHEGNDPDTVSVISLEGRTYPVDVMYLSEPTEDYIESAIKTVLDIHLKAHHSGAVVDFRNQREIFYYS